MNIAVIFAGGIGKRMNSRALPKQFLKLYGKEIIIYTLEHFENHPEIDAIVISCVENWISYLQKLLDKYKFQKVVKIVPGGETGQESIYHGLVKAQQIATEGKNIVLIHDGVRPLINETVITSCIETVKTKGSAVTTAPVIETIICTDSEKKVEDVIDRSKCLVARAPQCFWLSEILDCHEKAKAEGKADFIDSASLMSYYGKNLYTVDGPIENIKITTPMDFYTFRALFEARESSQLFGI